MNRCDICLDEKCKGLESEHKCNCDKCIHNKECHKFLHPTIRLTTKCTQSCSHCCFSCSPTSDKMMSLEVAKSITNFLKNNEIISLNIMGGEFYCNPNWSNILKMFLEIGCHIRLVSNGDWGNNDKVKEDLLDIKEKYFENFYISLSYDSYHTNQFTNEAISFLKDNNFNYNVGETSDVGDDGLIPIGRSECTFGFYGTFGCYCHNPKYQYSFLIDEIGNIYKCSFGVWQYATIQEYENGNFAKRFKEFNKKFYSIFIPSCTSCIRCARQDDAIVKN